MLTLSRYLFFLAFAAYAAAALLYLGYFAAARSRRAALAGAAAPLLLAGVVAQAAAIAGRWLGAGYAPFSNMFEYMSFSAWAIMVAFLLINRFYRVPLLGAFVSPIGLIAIAYASLFPRDVQPLVPALQSYWLVLHVSFAALGEGAFAVSFGAALMYLLRVRRPDDPAWGEWILESIFFFLCSVIGFLGLAAGFRSLPRLTGPTSVAPGSLGRLLGLLPLPLFRTPGWLGGQDAAGKLNTLLWSLAAGAVLYLLARLICRRSLRAAASGALAALNPEVLDEVSYRAVGIGFPLFTLGGLVFAMIWAQKAWGSYWSWDPKETWSLISWLFYSAYLHQRIVKGWEGRPAAWLATAGYAMVLFTLIGVNLLMSGLHSYAGG